MEQAFAKWILIENVLNMVGATGDGVLSLSILLGDQVVHMW